MTKRESILAAVNSALSGTTNVSDRIYRSRVTAFARSEHPAIVIEPVSENANVEAVHRVLWELLFAVIVIVRADNADTTADPIIEDAYGKIMSDATLDGMLVELVPISTDWQFVDADKPLGIVTMQFKASYQTAISDLSSI